MTISLMKLRTFQLSKFIKTGLPPRWQISTLSQAHQRYQRRRSQSRITEKHEWTDLGREPSLEAKPLTTEHQKLEKSSTISKTLVTKVTIKTSASLKANPHQAHRKTSMTESLKWLSTKRMGTITSIKMITHFERMKSRMLKRLTRKMNLIFLNAKRLGEQLRSRLKFSKARTINLLQISLNTSRQTSIKTWISSSITSTTHEPILLTSRSDRHR